jgi:hypothetical protein
VQVHHFFLADSGAQVEREQQIVFGLAPFICIASSTTNLTLSNGFGSAESHAATATSSSSNIGFIGGFSSHRNATQLVKAALSFLFLRQPNKTQFLPAAGGSESCSRQC